MIRSLLFFLLLSFTGWASEKKFNENSYIQIISKTIDEFSQKNELIWPEYDISTRPIIITFQNHHIYAFNLKSQNTHWKEIKIEGRKVLFSEKDEWGVTQVAMQGNFLIEGQEAFVINLDVIANNTESYLPFLVFIHERFHPYQFSHFTPNKEGVGRYQDHLNCGNLALMQLEEMLLIDYLKSDKKNREEILKDFLAVNASRQQLIQNESIRWENHQQVMEGLADYVSIKTYDVLPFIDDFNAREHLVEILQGYLKNNEITERAMKWRHYGVGATLAYVLDDFEIDWKAQVQQGNCSQLDILKGKFPLSTQEQANRLEKIKKNYHFNQIDSQVTKIVHQHCNFLDELRKEYEQHEGIVLALGKPTQLGISGGGVTKGMFFLENGSTLSLQDSSVSTTSNNKWKLEFSNLPFLFQEQGLRVFKVNQDCAIEIDGKKCLLSELMEQEKPVYFNALTWLGPTSKFQATCPGKLEINQNKITILFR